MPKFALVTIKPATATPAIIIGKAYQKRIPNIKATTEAVQTPDPGRGIETNKNKNNAPYFSYLLSYLLVFWNSQLKNKSKIDHLLKKSENGFRYINKKNAGIIFPNTANR